jgi:hypothetical protein
VFFRESANGAGEAGGGVNYCATLAQEAMAVR